MAVTAAKATVSDPWFEEIADSNGEEYPTTRETACLQLFLTDQTTAEVAAKDIMTIDEDEKPVDDKPNRLAWLLVQAATHYQIQQPQLIELVNAIRALSDNDLNLTEAQRERFPRWRTWKDLGAFELLLDDTRRSYWAYRYTLDEEFDGSPDDCYRRWESIQSFYAHRFIINNANGVPLNGIAQIATALENEEAQLDDSMVNAEVPAAAQWLLIAGKAIFGCTVDSHELDSHDSQSESKSGISRDRWNTWKKRLESLHSQEFLNARTRSLAKQALDWMEQVEG